MSTDRRRAHLRLLRALAQRLSLGSLLLRAWAVLTVVALAAVGADPVRQRLTWLVVAFAIACWLLDAHLLRQRRLYGKVYQRARVAPEAHIDFSLNTSAVEDDADDWSSLAFSKALLLFHGSILAALVVIGRLA